MWHNDEIMTNWKDSVMSKEEFEAKEAKKIGETYVRQDRHADAVVLIYKIEKKLHKMGFTYDEELYLTLGLEENIRVYTGVEYASVFNRLRDCYATKLSEDNTVSLYRKFEGRETEIDSDEFLKEPAIPKLAIEDVDHKFAVGGSLHAEMLATIEAYTRSYSNIEMNLHWPLDDPTATLYTITDGVRKQFMFLKSHVLTKGSERITYLALTFGVLV